jgi:hypothetical protein
MRFVREELLLSHLVQFDVVRNQKRLTIFLFKSEKLLRLNTAVKAADYGTSYFMPDEGPIPSVDFLHIIFFGVNFTSDK